MYIVLFRLLSSVNNGGEGGIRTRATFYIFQQLIMAMCLLCSQF